MLQSSSVSRRFTKMAQLLSSSFSVDLTSTVINITQSTTVTSNNNDKSFPKSFRKSYVTTPHGREWTWLLRVPLSVQCLLQQMNPITQPPVRYIHTAMPHASYTLHCAVRFSTRKPKKNLPFPLGATHPTGKQEAQLKQGLADRTAP